MSSVLHKNIPRTRLSKKVSGRMTVALHDHDSLKDILMSILLGIAAVLAVVALILGWMWVDGARADGQLSRYIQYLSSGI